ncbi:hypothetical protein IAD21_01403 [Abditibacteriota bacterium]|nr:hypothetical protein IAD21_01403 [Abditibacteriota bacterium]
MADGLISDAPFDEERKPNTAKRVALWRIKIANILSLMALGCFATGPLIVVCLYGYAWQQGLYPNPHASPVTHRGVWSSHEELGRGVMLLFDPPFYAFLLSIFSLLFKPTRRAWVILGSCVMFLILILSLIGLVED